MSTPSIFLLCKKMVVSILLVVLGAILMFLAKVKWLSLIGLIIALTGAVMFSFKRKPSVPDEPSKKEEKE